MVPLFCTGDGGNCYVSTANLDGETNLKLKTAPAATQSMLAGISPNSLGGLSALSGKVVAEPPSANIHDFNGSIDMEGAAAESLGAKQLLMRGTVLRNTSFCVGVVVYTGAGTWGCVGGASSGEALNEGRPEGSEKLGPTCSPNVGGGRSGTWRKA